MLEPKFSGGKNPFDSITWIERDVEIKEGEKVIFKQENVRMPEFFAGMSAEVISQKYLTQIAGVKESNVQDMYERVVKKLVQWAIEGEYLTKEEAEIYGHELRFLLVNQMVMFNSPVWFNVGVREHPQTSACYILEIDDSMESILQNAVIEGSIFKWGSGCGSNRSRLRGSEEAVSGGGHASGPVVFMEIYDAIANVVRSGGITRRAAKMEILNIDHPDIEIFIDSKPQQELLAKSLIRSGWDQIAAYDSVKLQNLNQAVRVTDEFMKAVETEGMWELKARVSGQVTKVVNAKSLFRRIAKAAWECGDPGIQFDSEINRWNTCAVDGNIEASNPCVVGETLVALADGRSAGEIRDLVGTKAPVYCVDKRTGALQVRNAVFRKTQTNAEIWKVTLDDGSVFKATNKHGMLLRDGSEVELKDLKPGDSLMPFTKIQYQTKVWGQRYWGLVDSYGRFETEHRKIASFKIGRQVKEYPEEIVHHRDRDGLNNSLENLEVMSASEHNSIHASCGENAMKVFLSRLTSEQYAAFSESVSRRVSGIGNPMFGKSHSDDSRKVMSASALKRHETPEWPKILEKLRNHDEVWLKNVRKAQSDRAEKNRVDYEESLEDRACVYCGSIFKVEKEETKTHCMNCRFQHLSELFSGKTMTLEVCQKISSTLTQKLEDDLSFRATRKDGQIESLQSKILFIGKWILEKGHELSKESWDSYKDEFKKGFPSRHFVSAKIVEKVYPEWDFVELAGARNHKVVSIDFDGCADVYNATVDEFHTVAYVTKVDGKTKYGLPKLTGIVTKNCSEFMFLNNTSCNLASINLLKFRKSDGTFDVEAFLQAIKVIILSQDALIDNSYYPTPKITEASRAYRPLGINYSNLAALLMSLGLPYDSEEGRALAQAITSLMTAYSYVVSNEIARKKGVFPAYGRNSVKMRKVLKQHRAAAFASEPTYPEAKRILYASRAFWDQIIGFASDDGKDLGFRNAQVSVLAPTGTVSWAMGCDSFGVEPYFQLVTIKSLRDGGTLKMVPVVAPMALRFMGYDEIQAKDIFEFIVNRGHVDGAPHLKPEHIPVFDCAIGRRPLSWVAHLKMMEVVQPFISGAISKTVNLPTNVTIEDIMQVYIDAWKRKLKSIIVYRYGSKDYQPLKGIDGNDLKWGQRKHIPDTCKAVRHKFEIGGLSGYLHPTPFESGQLAECFARMQKQGDLTNGLMDFALIMMSFALQYGAPLKAIVKKHMDTSYGPAGKVISDPVSGYKTVSYAKSVGEYIVHWLGLNFLTEKEQQEIGLIDHEAIRQERKTQAFKVEEVKSKSNVNTKTSISLTPQFGAQICIPCGVSMVPDGTCWICPLCKKKSGGCPS